MRKIFIIITALILFVSCENTDELKSVNSNKSNLTKNEKVIRELLDGFRSEKILYNGKYYTLKDSSVFEELINLNKDKEYFFIIADPFDIHKFELTNENMYISSSSNSNSYNYEEKESSQINNNTSNSRIPRWAGYRSRLELYQHANFGGGMTNGFIWDFFKGDCCSTYNRYYCETNRDAYDTNLFKKAFAMPYLNEYYRTHCSTNITYGYYSPADAWLYGLNDEASSMKFRFSDAKPDAECKLFLYIHAFGGRNCSNGEEYYILPNSAVIYTFTGGRDYAVSYFSGFNDCLSSYMYFYPNEDCFCH